MHNYIEKKIREDLFLSLSLSQLGKHDYCGNSFNQQLFGYWPISVWSELLHMDW